MEGIHASVIPSVMGPGFSIGAMAQAIGISPILFGVLLLIISLWTIGIKGYALWHGARNGQRGWFIALLLLNTLGILEVVYLYFFKKDKNAPETPSLFEGNEEVR